MSSDRPLGHIDADRFRATLSPEAYARLMEATAQSAREVGYFVVLGRQEGTPSEERVGAFAKGLGLDAYTARQRLMAPTPRILRREESKPAADKWVAWLRALGLKGFRLSERAFMQFHPITVLTFKKEEGGLTFELENGRLEKVRPEEVLCLVNGAVRTKQVAETATKDFLGAGKFKGQETLRVTRESRVDVHLANVALIFRLAQDRLAFDRLFPDQPTGSDLLMQRVLRRLTRAYPAAPVLDDFAKAGDVLGQSWGIASQSIEFRYSTIGTAAFSSGTTDRRVVQESDVETFDLYSLLSRMQMLAG